MHVIDRTFRDLIGEPCWGVQWEHQLGLELSFGAPRLSIREPYASQYSSPRLQRYASYRNITVKGAWWLWALCGKWRLRLLDDERTFGASSPPGKRREVLGLLDGQLLIGAGVNASDGSTDLLFDRGAALSLWGSVCEEPEIWSLYEPNGRVLVVRADGLYSHEMSTRSERWHSLG